MRPMFRPHVSLACTAAALSAALLLAGCKKKEEPAPAAAASAAAAAGQAVAGAAAAAAAPAAPKVEPPPADIELTAGESVVAWLSLRSFTAVFDAIEALASKFGAAPPGVSLRQSALDDASKMFAAAGVVGHEWIDKGRPWHLVMQDDSPQAPQNGVFLMLPVVGKDKTLEALTAAKKGADAAGHAAVVALGQQQAYVDFVGDTYALVAIDPARFGKAKAFAERIAALQVPSLAYLGLSVKDALVTRSNEVNALLAQVEQMAQAGGAGAPGNAAALGYYTKMLREWSQAVERVELLVDASVDDLQVNVRMHLQPDSKLGKQVYASRGRLAVPLAAQLPSNAYLAFVSNLDASANLEQVKDSVRMLGEMFKLPAEEIAALEGDLRAAIEKQDGTGALAVYPDGESPLGLLAWAGAKDPEAVLKLGKKVASVLILKAIEAEEAKARAADPNAAPDPQLAIVKKAVTDMKIDPLLRAYGAIAKEKGVTLTANTTSADGASCDVLDVAIDWAKIKASAPSEDAARAAALIGARTAVALCTGGAKLALTAGPSAFEQGRRAVTGKTGGLDAAPVFKASVDKGVKQPAWVLYANAGAGAAAFAKAIPEAGALQLPADRAVTMTCGFRTRSYDCEVDVPVALVTAIQAASRANRPASP